MLKPDDTFGDYTVVKLLGKGGMGAVYLLRNAGGGEVAAKILDPAEAGDHESRRRFLREAELALGVKHPNLVETYDVGEDPETGFCYILMEYAPAGSLADRIKAGPLPVNDAIRIVYQIASVLELARGKGIVHRDIKPGNILFGADGKAKLADLGIARGGFGGAETTTVTQTGMMIGTPAYMAPEQMLDAHHVDTRADIYSLGIVFFEMLTGERPNKDDTVVQLMAKAVAGEPIPDVRTLRPEVSVAIAELISLMCAMKAEERIATPVEVTTAISQIVHGHEVTIRRKAPKAVVQNRKPSASSADSSRRALGIVFAMLALAGAAVFAYVGFVGRTRSEPKPTVIVHREVLTNVVERVSVVTNVPTSVRSNAGNARQQANIGNRTWFFADAADGVILCCAEDRALGSKPCIDPLPEGKLEIPRAINGRPVVGIGRFAFNRCTKLKEVVIPDEVRTIDHGAFHGCGELKTVTLPAALVSLTGEAFRRCPKLAHLSFANPSGNFAVHDGILYSARGDSVAFCPPAVSTFPRLLPSVTRIGDGAFCGCTIERATLPDRITDIGKGAFSFCANLRTVELPRSLERIGNCAFGFSGLHEILIPEGVRVIEGETFRGCAGLERIVLPASLQEIRGHAVLEGCAALSEIVFRGDAPSTVGCAGGKGGLFLGTSKKLRVLVERNSRGWNGPDAATLPTAWPVGAGENARQIRYGDDVCGATAEVTGEKAFEWLVHPPSPDKRARIFAYGMERHLIGDKRTQFQSYFKTVGADVSVRFEVNAGLQEWNFNGVNLVFLWSRNPRVPYSDDERKRLNAYMENGGHVMVFSNDPRGAQAGLLRQFGLDVENTPLSSSMKAICPGLEGSFESWQARGRGIPLPGDSQWLPMVVTGDEKAGIVMAVRSVGRGKLIFVASGNLTSYAGNGANRGWWSRVLQGCGIAIRDPLSAQEKRTFDPERLKDPDSTRAVQKALDALFPGWKTSEIGNSGSLGYWRERDGETDIICTHPPRRGVPAVLSKTLVVEGKSPVLHVRIANNEEESQFRLRIRVAGRVVREKDITSGWTDVYVDLRRWSGKKTKIELEHLPTGWFREWAFWSAIEVVDDAALAGIAVAQDGEAPVKILDRKQIVGNNPEKAAQRTCDALFPGWKVSECGHPEEAGYEEEHKGRYNLLFTHPPREDVPVVLSRRMNLPRKAPKLYVSVIGGDDFELQVKVNGKIVLRPDVNGREWTDLTVDLSKWAGRNVLLEVLNMPTGWHYEEAHWQRLEIK